MSNADAGIRGQDVKIAGVEEMNKLFVDRELRMIELKERIKVLEDIIQNPEFRSQESEGKA